MKTINSKAVTLALQGLTHGMALQGIDDLLKDHGLEITVVNTQDTMILMVDSTVTETIVMATPPTTPMDGAQFRRKNPAPV